MIAIKVINRQNSQDINIPNEAFPLVGRMIPLYDGRQWSYTTEKFDQPSEMTFPDENYSFDAMQSNSVFLGAYDGDTCIGLAILQQGFFKYMYLYDLKINRAYRGTGAAAQLMEAAMQTAIKAGYRGIYTQGQDNNLIACKFYLKCGFRIGGLDTEVYKGTAQEGKADILFYMDA